MVRKYIKDMTVKEIIDRLQKKETIKSEDSKTDYITMIHDNIVKFSVDESGTTHCFINYQFDISSPIFYFEDKDSIQITETGLYKTRDGQKAFISIIFSNVGNEASGVIEGSYKPFTWKCNGRIYDEDVESENDIVSKWEE